MPRLRSFPPTQLECRYPVDTLSETIEIAVVLAHPALRTPYGCNSCQVGQ